MKQNVQDYKRLLISYDSSTGLYTERSITDKERLELSTSLLKYPGEMNLDHRILVARSRAQYFEDNGYYTPFVEDSMDYNNFFEESKKIIYSGLLIDNEYYITGDAMWYLNFIRIPDKVKQLSSFPRIFDTDLWFFQLLELARLNQKFTITLKKRQIGVSLKLLAKILKRFWFEERAKCKIACWDERYLKANWIILEDYKDFLNEHTAWYRPLQPERTLHWEQVTKTLGNKKGSKGLKSVLLGVNTKANPAAVVSGGVTEAFIDEAGVNPSLSETVGFLEPALKFGDIITGEVHIAGAVGNLEQSGPLKNLFFNPGEGNFLELPNIHSKRPDEKVGIFIPEEYSYGSFIDEYGNSLTEQAGNKIEELAEKKKKESSYDAYVIYRSQSPRTPEDCFRNSTANVFNVSVIEPHFDFLLKNYDPVIVTLREEKDKIKYSFGSKYPLVTDYPTSPKTILPGAVVIDEPPISETPPFGLYYSATDPIRPIRDPQSPSLQVTYIFKAAHEINGELHMDKMVAWYAGRRDDPYESYQISSQLSRLYNAREAVENDQAVYIEWLIGKNLHKNLMKRSEMPILTDWVPSSRIGEEYGWRTGGSTVKNNLIDLVVSYTEEVIGTTFDEQGNSYPIYGVTRIKDVTLLREMLNYKGGNADRIIAFGGALMVARANTNRGVKVRTLSAEDDRLRTQAIQQHKPMPFNSLIRIR